LFFSYPFSLNSLSCLFSLQSFLPFSSVLVTTSHLSSFSLLHHLSLSFFLSPVPHFYFFPPVPTLTFLFLSACTYTYIQLKMQIFHLKLCLLW
jgi:hypothetical protein